MPCHPPAATAHRARRGFTLIELMIVVAVLAITLAIVVPVLFRDEQPTNAATEAALVEEVRRLAVARAEPLRLAVQPDGAWQVLREGSADVVASGQMAEAPGSAYEIRMTELGACLPATGGGPAINAVSCTVRR